MSRTIDSVRSFPSVGQSSISILLGMWCIFMRDIFSSRPYGEQRSRFVLSGTERKPFLPSSSTAAAYDALGTLFVFCEFRPRKKQKRTASHHFAKRPLVGGMAWRGCRKTAVRESGGVVWI